MCRQQQTITKNSSTFSKLDELRNVLALLVSKNNKLAEVCKELRKYRLAYTPSQVGLYLDEHPITRFEREMAKNLEGCLNDFDNLYDSYKEEQTIEHGFDGL